jgi:hypothetical protein
MFVRQHPRFGAVPCKRINVISAQTYFAHHYDLAPAKSSIAVDDPSIAHTTGPVRKVRTGFGLGQASEGVVGRALYLQLGSFRLEGPIDSCCSENPDHKRMIGTEVLRRFTVILDYARNRIILEPNAQFKDPFPDA